MPVAFNEHAHQPSKAWKGEGGWGGGGGQSSRTWDNKAF